jgi:hypothetical protein
VDPCRRCTRSESSHPDRALGLAESPRLAPEPSRGRWHPTSAGARCRHAAHQRASPATHRPPVLRERSSAP